MEQKILQDYLSQIYQGSRSFLQEVIFPIFGEDNFEDGYDAELLENQPEYQTLAHSTGVGSVKAVGSFYIGAEPLMIFDITVTDSVLMQHNRSGIQQLVRRAMDVYSCAFMLFHYADDTRWDWRFTFCHKGGSTADATDSKRFTFLLGPGQSCRTAADNFMNLFRKRDNVEVKDIEDAFSVEALSNEFFKKYKNHYEDFVAHITGKKYVPDGKKYVERTVNPNNDKQLYAAFGNDDRRVRDYVKRLLGRIVFLHFLQKKGWLGLPAGAAWDSKQGNTDFMWQLFDQASPEQQADFLDAVLEPLFAAIDTDRSDVGDLYETRVMGTVRVPYLNGGLFERDADDQIPSRFPSELFHDLLDFFRQYNFTVDENDPNDAQVGIDPEMLSRIFENLLEDNKDKGAYYTPKEVVRHMCRESLIAYLQTGYDDAHQQNIRNFVLTHDSGLVGDIKADVDKRLRDVKVCDPAIGSGAFPMGMLREIFLCRQELEGFSDPAAIKRQIIQDNLYGVDIESGAVEIARLRFWLALVVDEQSPETLPNLDFRIMQGNSLLESYEGIDLSRLSTTSNLKIYEPQRNIWGEIEDRQMKIIFTQTDQLQGFQTHLKQYFSVSNHSERLRLRVEIESFLRQILALTFDQYRRGEEKKLENIISSAKLSAMQQKAAAECRAKIQHYQQLIDILPEMPMTNSHFFLWHTWFYDVLSRPSKQGFDIVIGNPPYIQIKKLDLKDEYKKVEYSTFDPNGDLYCLFYELATKILAKKGIGVFITSNKWLKSNYGVSLRKYLIKNANPKILIDLGPGVFESAAVDTCILIWNKHEYNNQTYFTRISGRINSCKLVYKRVELPPGGMWNAEGFMYEPIKRKIELINTKLKDFDVELDYGILTGANKAFILNEEKATQLIALDTKNSEIIKPILRGQDLGRYFATFNHIYLLCSHNGVKKLGIPPINIERDYPTLITYFDSFGDGFKNRGEQGNTFYNLRNIAYIKKYESPKIIYADIVQDKGKFYYDEEKYYTNDTAFLISGKNLKYLVGLLNSTAFNFFYKQFYCGSSLGKSGLRFKRDFLLRVPIPKANHTVKKEIEELAVSAFTLRKENHSADISFQEKYIDLLVYHLYGLTYDEVLIIDPETPITREEYEAGK